MTGNPPPTWHGKYRHWNRKTIIVGAVVVLLVLWMIFGLVGCQGQNKADAPPSAFQNGTTKHPLDYDKIFEAGKACAMRYVEKDTAAANRIARLTVDSVARGGISIIGQDSMTRMLHGGIGNAISRTPEQRLYLTERSASLKDVIDHEMDGHLLAGLVPALRNPPYADSTNSGDHSGAYFRACIQYCPGCPGHPNES